MSTDNYIYLYCVTQAQPNLKNLGVLAEGIFVILAGNLCASVCYVPENEFNEDNLKKNITNLEWLKTHAERHERIIEGIMGNTAVIPSKFATVFFNEQSLQSFLDKYAVDLNDKLNSLANKEEWDVKIYCDPEQLTQSILLEDKSLLELDYQISTASPGKAYLLRKKKNGLIAEAVENGIVRYRKAFLARLENFCSQSKINATTARQFTGRNDDMILNAAFLVEKKLVPEFIEQVQALDAEWKCVVKRFYCESSGPWPPYNFCQLTER